MLDYRQTMDNFPDLRLPEDPRMDEERFTYSAAAQNSNFFFLLAKLAPFIKWLKELVAEGESDTRFYASQVKWLDNRALNQNFWGEEPKGPAQNYSGEEYSIIGFTDSDKEEFSYRLPWQDEKPELLRSNEGTQTRRYWTAKDLLALLEEQLRRRLTRCDKEFLNFLSEYIEK